MSTINQNVLNYLQDLIKPKFWGNVTVSIQNGQIANIRVEQLLKPTELPGTPVKRNAISAQ